MLLLVGASHFWGITNFSIWILCTILKWFEALGNGLYFRHRLTQDCREPFASLVSSYDDLRVPGSHPTTVESGLSCYSPEKIDIKCAVAENKWGSDIQ